MRAIDAAVIGCSAGGLQVLMRILNPLPAELDIAIVIVSHTPADGHSLLPQLLGRDCRMAVSEAEEREPLLPGHVYVAPPNYHLLIEPDRTFALSVDPRVCNVRPAVDVLFAAAADAYGHRLAGIVLTGANADGAKGLRAVADAGGACLVQDPESATADTMPRAAIAAVPDAKVLAIDGIARELLRLCN